MKNIRLLVIFIFTIIGCSEDKGNYDYDWIDNVDQVKLNNSLYECTKGETVHLSAKCTFAEGKTEDDYTYTWILNSIGTESPSRDTIGTGKTLDYFVNVPPRNYLLICEVFDKIDGITWFGSSYFYVSGSMTGWLFMEDHNGVADISMYGLNSDGEKIYLNKVLANSGVPEELRQGPRKVEFVWKSGGLKKGPGIWVMTDASTYYLDVDNGHTYGEGQVISNYMLTSVGEHYPTKCITRMSGATFGTVLVADDGIYYSMFNEMLFDANLNWFNKEELDIAPYVIGSVNVAMVYLMFDNNSKKFLSFQTNGMWVNLPDQTPTGIPYPKGDELVFMQNLKNDFGSAIMKGTDGYYEVQFKAEMMGATLMNREPMANADNLNENSIIAFHQMNKRPYYSDGNDKIYTYSSGVETPIYVKSGSGIRLEGKITAITSRYFFNTHMDAWKYLAEYEEYLLIATELDNGKGRVYIMEPTKTGHSSMLSVVDVVDTDAPVVSISYQDPY